MWLVVRSGMSRRPNSDRHLFHRWRPPLLHSHAHRLERGTDGAERLDSAALHAPSFLRVAPRQSAFVVACVTDPTAKLRRLRHPISSCCLHLHRAHPPNAPPNSRMDRFAVVADACQARVEREFRYVSVLPFTSFTLRANVASSLPIHPRCGAIACRPAARFKTPSIPSYARSLPKARTLPRSIQLPCIKCALHSSFSFAFVRLRANAVESGSGLPTRRRVESTNLAPCVSARTRTNAHPLRQTHRSRYRAASRHRTSASSPLPMYAPLAPTLHPRALRLDPNERTPLAAPSLHATAFRTHGRLAGGRRVRWVGVFGEARFGEFLFSFSDSHDSAARAQSADEPTTPYPHSSGYVALRSASCRDLTRVRRPPTSVLRVARERRALRAKSGDLPAILPVSRPSPITRGLT
ncbi:hypothetical protein B0H12DRAFT_1326903 [Mycena haematopus]|nr:hypothetical protein B0H12DRAFT_1326903 [Mycena haematopus]